MQARIATSYQQITCLHSVGLLDFWDGEQSRPPNYVCEDAQKESGASVTPGSSSGGKGAGANTPSSQCPPRPGGVPSARPAASPPVSAAIGPPPGKMA